MAETPTTDQEIRHEEALDFCSLMITKAESLTPPLRDEILKLVRYVRHYVVKAVAAHVCLGRLEEAEALAQMFLNRTERREDKNGIDHR
jgi:hypothetical protein